MPFSPACLTSSLFELVVKPSTLEEILKEQTPGVFEWHSSFLTETNGVYTVVPHILRLILLAYTPTHAC